MKAEGFGGSEMNGGIQVKTRWTQHIVAACATAVMLITAGSAIAAQFTPGNVAVMTSPRTGSPGIVAITVTEYTSAGGLVQSFTLPTTQPAPFGGVDGNTFTQGQINFSDDNNQLLYCATRYTNSTSI